MSYMLHWLQSQTVHTQVKEGMEIKILTMPGFKSFTGVLLSFNTQMPLALNTIAKLKFGSGKC